MTRRPKCPMMMYGMPMMPMMQDMEDMEDANMPNMMNMPPMPDMMNMSMVEGMEMEHHFEDEEDDKHFMKMHSEHCKRMMPYVKDAVDRMEEKSDILDEEYPDRDMVGTMTEDAYRSMIKDMPDMAEEEEERQYPRRRFVRDLLGVLLVDELLRRRRRHRRRRPHGYPYDGYGYGREDDYDYYYHD